MDKLVHSASVLLRAAVDGRRQPCNTTRLLGGVSQGAPGKRRGCNPAFFRLRLAILKVRFFYIDSAFLKECVLL